MLIIWIVDYFKTCLSIGVAALANVRIILTALLPYLGLLAAFGLFILWNGSVVLGEYQPLIAIGFITK